MGQNIDGFQIDELYIKAIALIQRESFEEVPGLLERYLEKHRNKLSEKAYTTVLGQLAVSYSQTENLEKSIKAYNELLPLRKQHHGLVLYALSLANLGKVYTRTGQYSLAEDCFKEAIAIDKRENASFEQLSIVYEQFASLLHDTGRLRQALKSILIILPCAFSEKQTAAYNNPSGGVISSTNCESPLICLSIS